MKIDVLGNPIKTPPEKDITATWVSNFLQGITTVTSVGGNATFSTLNMPMPLRGSQTITFTAPGVVSSNVIYNVLAGKQPKKGVRRFDYLFVYTGKPHHLMYSNASAYAVCDATISIPTFQIRVFDSGNGELFSYASTVFYINPVTPITLLGNATTSSTFPFAYNVGVVQGALNMFSFQFTIESSRTPPPGPNQVIAVNAGPPRNMTISPTSLSIDVQGPTINLPAISVIVKDFCGNVPNVPSAMLTVRSLNSTLNFINGATLSTVIQDVTLGSTSVVMQFSTPSPGTYQLSFEVSGVQPVVLTVNVVPGSPYPTDIYIIHTKYASIRKSFDCSNI